MTDRARVPLGGGGHPSAAGAPDDEPAPDAGETAWSPRTDSTKPGGHDEGPWLGLPAAAELAGVHYMTVYRWVRTSRLAAEKSGGTWKVRRSAVETLVAGGRKSAPKVASSGEHRRAGMDGGRVAPMTEALLRGDSGGAWLLVEESQRAGIDPVDVLCELLEPAMAEIGRRWRNGAVSVAQEHRATVVVSRMIGRLSPTVTRPGRSRGFVLVGALEGNRHALGPAVVADVFRAAGYEVCDLGADVPTGDLVAEAKGADKLAAVCLSVAVDDRDATVREAVARLRSITDAPILVGGTGAPNAAWADAVGADGWCADGRSAPSLIDRLSGAPKAGRRLQANRGAELEQGHG